MGPTKIFQNIPMAFLPILNAGQIMYPFEQSTPEV